MSASTGDDASAEFYLSDSDSGFKRKGSPLSKDEPIKKQISSEDLTLRRQSSDPSLSKSAAYIRKPAKGKTKPVAFSDMIKLSFNDQSFRDSITPVLIEMTSPLIIETVNVATADMKSVVDDMIKSNQALQDTVKKQTQVINDQKLIIKEQKDVINEQKIMIDSNSNTVEELQCTIDLMTSELDQLRFSHNELEQYGRRNSLRINNLKFEGLSSPPRDEEQLADATLRFLNSVVLTGDQKLDLSDIERCHYVGKPKRSGTQQILVKFSRYRDKQRVFLSKKNLKNYPDKTFITEDLTAVNHSVIKSLLPLKKDGLINSFWTRDGRIIVKKGKDDQPIRVLPSDNIRLRLGLVSLPHEAMEEGPTSSAVD